MPGGIGTIGLAMVGGGNTGAGGSSLSMPGRMPGKLLSG